ncbi:class I SAM-dependent methyltransferase [Patulibacter defluvii]|uniref:class I SAM-dependent methyltransferase n=1 Tax=Patulibacter defluvii TaxID=3095358 RepID=UPI002A763D49|nr:class I SAM-dependent methyltransferase [Patulibacter sp. DM4]
MPGLGRVKDVARRFAADPTWIGERVRQARTRKERGEKSLDLEALADLTLPVETLIEQVLGVDAAGREALEGQLEHPEQAAGDGSFASRGPLLRIVGTTVLARRPETVVETGVQRGYTSAVLLAAMERVGTGRLISIDLPGIRDAEVTTGELVPDAVRHRWDLRLGPSRRLLPEALAEAGTVGLSIHDADHSYRAQVEEFRAAWPHIASGGLLVCDDVWTPSITDFANEVGVHPALVVRGPSDAVGVLVKP